MKRRLLAVLLISGLLLVAVVPLKSILSSPFSGVDSSSDDTRAMYALQDVSKSDNETEKPRPKYVAGELIIKFKGEAAEGEIAGLRAGQGAEEVYVSPFTFARRWRIPPSKTVEDWADFFDKNPLVEYVEPNYFVYAAMTPDDPVYSFQWHLDNVDYGGICMEAAWDMETGDPNVVVAVVDTGVAYEDYPAPPHWHIDTYQAYGGTGNSWWCGLDNPDWATPPGYGNGWKDYLQRVFDLTTATGSVTFSYQYRHDLEAFLGTPYDRAFTEISTDEGGNWTVLETYTSRSRSRPTNDWKQESIDLSSYAGGNVLIRFRVYSDRTYSDEDGDFNSNGAFFVDEIEVEDDSGIIFYDNVESGPGDWETTQYEQAPDLAGTSFWTNSDEIPENGIDDDGNGFVDDANGWDFVDSDAHPNDDVAHGTHVAGTVAQTTNNNFGVAGVAFETTVMPVKVLSAAGTGTYQQVADGIYYAVNNGADIVNLSLGGSAPSPALEDAVAYAYNNGVTVFAASGNGYTDSCDYPAAYDSYVIAVGATQYDETRAPYSNHGSSLDIVAPGGNTGVDQNNDGYADGVLQNTFGDTPVDWAYWFYQGTSMSTPHTSGVAALLLARNSTLTPDQIRDTLESTAEDLGASGRDDIYGWGLIDAQAALQSVARASTQFDFGTGASSVESGYTAVSESTAYSAFAGYGWENTAGLVSRDRSLPDDLRRDLVFSGTDRTFNVDLENGEYQVILVVGDQSYMHDLMDVYAEGILKVNDLTVASGTFTQVGFTVTVSDGQLNLVFHDDGGTDGNWVINAIVVRPPPPPASTHFDFGTGSSPVEWGYTAVSESTAYSAFVGYGWGSGVGLGSRDRGAPDNLGRDFVFSPTENTFNVDLANGDYQITVIIGDQSFMHDRIDVYAENNLVINDLTTTAGSFQQETFWVTVTDGQLNLRILDDGGADPNWVINTLTIEPGSPPSPPAEAAFDFGASGSPVEAGYTQITESTLYSASAGYGWTATSGLGSRDRGVPDDLRRDLVYSSVDRTFNVDLQNGEYHVILVIGDHSYMHDLIDVYAKGLLKVSDLTVPAGTFSEVVFTVTVGDGQLNLVFHDDGGTDPNWVINAITLEPVS